MSEDTKPRLRYSSDGRAMPTLDGLKNVISGMGTDRDKRSYAQFDYGRADDLMELEAAYTTNWIARQVIDAPVEDATREWRVFSLDEATEIRKTENALGLQAATQEAFMWSGLYGGAGVLMITDQPFELPLDHKKIKKGSLKRLLVLDRMLITPHSFNNSNPMAENYLQPDYYLVNGGAQQIHHSHFVRAPGAMLPLRLRMINQGWDDSQLRRCMEDIKDAASAKGGIASLIQEASIDIITKEGLSDALSSGDMDQQVANRYTMFGMMKSMFRLGLLDSTEEYTRHPASFGGLGEVLSTLMEWVSGAAKIPMTRLFGVQSKGMGDTGAGDMNNYYNSIRGRQESEFRQFLEAIDRVMIPSALGHMPDDIEFDWNPLAQPTDTELAQQQLAFAQADDIRLTQQVVKRSQLARKLAEQGVYAISDEDIEQMQADEKAERDGEDYIPLDGIEANDSQPVGYVSVRPSIETARKIAEHLKAAGIEDGIAPEDMHVTLFYARDGIPGGESLADAGAVYEAEMTGKYRVMGNAPWRALTVELQSQELIDRFSEIAATGAKHSYPQYLPHLSLKYAADEEDLRKLQAMPLEPIALDLGGELWKPIKP